MSQKIIELFITNYGSMDPEHTALEVLRNNTYCVLSTATLSGEPWATPVRFQCDTIGNLYWTSARDAKHSGLVAENNRVSAVVIDLRFIDTVSSAVYFSGIAREIPYQELPELIHWRYPEGNRTLKDFDLATQHRSVYQLRTEHMWCLASPEIINDVATDKRIEIDLQIFKQLNQGAKP